MNMYRLTGQTRQAQLMLMTSLIENLKSQGIAVIEKGEQVPEADIVCTHVRPYSGTELLFVNTENGRLMFSQRSQDGKESALLLRTPYMDESTPLPSKNPVKSALFVIEQFSGTRQLSKEDAATRKAETLTENLTVLSEISRMIGDLRDSCASTFHPYNGGLTKEILLAEAGDLKITYDSVANELFAVNGSEREVFSPNMRSESLKGSFALFPLAWNNLPDIKRRFIAAENTWAKERGTDNDSVNSLKDNTEDLNKMLDAMKGIEREKTRKARVQPQPDLFVINKSDANGASPEKTIVKELSK